jgi:hypothetical protein
MTTTLCVLVLALFSILVKSKSKPTSIKNYLPVFGTFPPSVIFAQNGEIGGGSNSEIIFWLFVLGFLVSIMPKRETKFQQKAMTIVKITILGVLFPLSISAQSSPLPDFSTAKKADTDIRIDGWNDTNAPYLPLLNACEFGSYNTYWYILDKDSTLWFWGKIPMDCLSLSKYPKVPLDDVDREIYSTAVRAQGYGTWYAVLDAPDCGYVYKYVVVSGGFTWELSKTVCK